MKIKSYMTTMTMNFKNSHNKEKNETYVRWALAVGIQEAIHGHFLHCDHHYRLSHLTDTVRSAGVGFETGRESV